MKDFLGTKWKEIFLFSMSSFYEEWKSKTDFDVTFSIIRMVRGLEIFFVCGGVQKIFN